MIKFLTLLGYDPAKHSVKVEMLAGLTTFLTMSYILAVNPLILCETGMDKGAVFSATVIAAAIATMVMAFYAKMPFALASGMGINAFFAYTLVLVMGYTWQQALAAVFVEGIVFIILTFLRVREAIVNAIPINLRYSISVGIGLFIAFIGLKNGGIIVANDATMTALAPWSATTLIAVGGIILGSILLALKVRGALFYTILIMTIVGIPFGVTQLPENFSLISMPHSLEPIAFHIDFSRFTGLDVNYIIVVLTLLFMDLFDTLGTLIGAATGALTSFTVGMLFLVSLFFSPVFLMIPSAATTSALFLVGVMMLRSIVHIDFIDFTEAMPSLVTILMMPFTASISEGIVMGLLAYVFVKLCTGRYKELSVVMYILAVLFVLKYLV